MGTRQKFQVIAVCGLLLLVLGCQPPGARALFEGEARLKAGEPKLAIAQFEKAVKLLPGEWRAWNYLGLARHRAGDLDGAHEAFQRAMEMAGERRNSPEDASFVLKFNTGRLAIDRERLADAKTELHAYSISAEPSFHAYFWLGEVYRKEMNWASASTEYQKALAQDDHSAVAHNRLGMAQLRHPQPIVCHGRVIILREGFLVFRASRGPIHFLAIHFSQPEVRMKRGLSRNGIGVQFCLSIRQPFPVNGQPARIEFQNKRGVLRGVPPFTGHFHRPLKRFMGSIQIARPVARQAQIIPGPPFARQQFHRLLKLRDRQLGFTGLEPGFTFKQRPCPRWLATQHQQQQPAHSNNLELLSRPHE